MTNLYIVDDHSVVLEGILSLLQNSHDIFVCGTAKTAADCILFLEKNTLDVMLMDINLPDMNGVVLCKKVKNDFPEVKILALSTFNQISYINKMIVNGANGYLLKNITKSELTDAIQTVISGQNYYSHEVSEILKIAKTKGEIPELTKRETDI